MRKYDDCEFCFLKDGSEPHLPSNLQILGVEKLKENIMFDGDSFYVKPDISPIVWGHLLIIPKKHYFSILSIPKDKFVELEFIKKKIINFYKENEQKCLFFEHGCCGESDVGSSCIHHAHLHSIPIDDNNGRFIVSEAIKILGIPEVNTDDIENYSYLSLELSGSSTLYWRDTIYRSQFFRILISEICGEVQRSRWQNCIIDANERLKSEKWLEGLKNIKFI